MNGLDMNELRIVATALEDYVNNLRRLQVTMPKEPHARSTTIHIESEIRTAEELLKRANNVRFS